jgi:hypothetical protein
MTNDLQTRTPDEHNEIWLHRYIHNEGNLRSRVNVGLAALSDALKIYNSAVGAAYFPTAPEIPSELLSGAKVFGNRRDLLKSLPVSGGFTLEIGVMTGAFSREIIDHIQPSKHVMADLGFLILDREMFKTEFEADKIVLLQGNSKNSLNRIPDQSLDFAYVDGGHNSEDVLADIEHVKRIMKPGGYVQFNDYECWSINEGVPYGVEYHVNKFICDLRLQVVGICLMGSGGRDIAVRMPS